MLSKKRFIEIVGSNVRKVRHQRGLGQDALAEKGGFYRTYINLVETAKRTPSSYNLYRLAKALEVSVKELLPNTVEKD